MPCYDLRDSPEYAREEARNTTNHDSVMAQLLCEAMKLYTGQKENPSVKLKQWWEEHKERDARREEMRRRKLTQQLEKKKALSKLTMREKRLLGVR